PPSPAPYPSIGAAVADRVLEPTLPEITLPAAFARVPVPSAADPYLCSLAVVPVGDPRASSVAASLSGLLVASVALGIPSPPQPQMEGSNVDLVNDRFGLVKRFGTATNLSLLSVNCSNLLLQAEEEELDTFSYSFATADQTYPNLDFFTSVDEEH
ncbi:hypothetical protein B296_00059077, partial [Ensete ventricosum]